MTVESVAIYLGIVKAGMVVISIADSFAAEEISVRLRIGKARAIFTGDRILRTGKSLPLFEKVCAAKAPRAVVIPADGKLSVEWKKSLAAFRDTPNAYCKLSAFTSAMGGNPAPTDPKRYGELFDAIVDVFGAKRVFFGSNWPVSKNAGEYAPLPLILEQYLKSRDNVSIDAVFRANTLRAYGLDR